MQNLNPAYLQWVVWMLTATEPPRNPRFKQSPNVSSFVDDFGPTQMHDTPKDEQPETGYHKGIISVLSLE